MRVQDVGFTGGFTLGAQPCEKFGTQNIKFLRRFLRGPIYDETRILIRFGNDVKVDMVDALVCHPSVVLCGVVWRESGPGGADHLAVGTNGRGRKRTWIIL
jgi:hypothetical protein